MKRTTVKISDELDARLRHEAALRGVPISDITREALELYFSGRDSGYPFAPLGSSGYNDTARRIEELLREAARR